MRSSKPPTWFAYPLGDERTFLWVCNQERALVSAEPEKAVTDFTRHLNIHSDYVSARTKKPGQPPVVQLDNRTLQQWAEEKESKASDLERQLKFYVPLNVEAINSQNSTLSQSLENVMQKFLSHHEMRVMLLQGESGSGKSLSLLHLKKQLQTSQINPHHLDYWHVLYIQLKRYDQKNIDKCLDEKLAL